MALEMHSINGIRNMEVIDISTGSKLGFIKDLKIDTDSDTVISILLPGDMKSWFGREEEKEIPWENIVKIGTDVILVKIESQTPNTEQNV